MALCTNQGFKSLIPLAGTDGEFLYYQLLQNRDRYKRFGIGSTFLEVSKRDTENFKLWFPTSPNEQRKIALYLSEVDDAIEHSEDLILKFGQIKTGVMHDLFTRGLDENGQLRSPRSESPEMYKDSPLGWIPRQWVVRKLDDVIRVIDCKHFTPKYVDQGYPIIRPRNVKAEGLDFSSVDCVTESDYKLLTDIHEPCLGDIVFSRNASFGVGCLVRTPEKFAIGQDVVIMIKKDADTGFISQALKSAGILSQIARVSAGSTFGRINLAEIRGLYVSTPTIAEQAEIWKRLSSIDTVIRAEKSYLIKLRQIKQGLMKDLLNGEVPIISIEPASEPAHV
jgi:type I restriction enzyme S subunit